MGESAFCSHNASAASDQQAAIGPFSLFRVSLTPRGFFLFRIIIIPAKTGIILTDFYGLMFVLFFAAATTTTAAIFLVTAAGTSAAAEPAVAFHAHFATVVPCACARKNESERTADEDK